MSTTLRPVVEVLKDKCVNCHRCIAVCPAKMCNDGSGDHVEIHSDLCLGCGECITACTHGARRGIDDSEQFFNDLAAGIPIVAIVAPAAAASFGGNYLQLNGWLASLGVKGFFDVSFGAELTVKSYLEFKKAQNPRCIIAQPCPTLVTFIELYRPELIPMLAPADSPMAHTMKMIRRFYPPFKNHKIAVISPCYSKRREFDAIGLGDYNVTFNSLEKKLSERGETITSFTERDYDTPPAERAVLFSTPGGLMRTAERDAPGLIERTRKIEGHPEIYHYLAHLGNAIKKGEAPIHDLIDCLNCEMGCNGGPGTSNRGKHPDAVEGAIEKRSMEHKARFATHTLFKSGQKAKRKLKKLVDSCWEPGLYDRSYVDRSESFKSMVRKPSTEEINVIHKRTHKTKQEHILNCGACGYNSCEQMAVAIINGLNRPENCRHYMSVEVALLHNTHKDEINDIISSVSAASVVRLEKNISDIRTLADGSTEMASCVVESSSSIEQMVANVQSITRVLEQNAQSVQSLEDASETGREGLDHIAALISQIAGQSDGMIEASTVIQRIASQTNLLAMNAAIEAAHAGQYGRGFAVVADEIRKLAESAGAQASSISKVLKNLKGLIDQTTDSSREAQRRFGQVLSLTAQVREQEAVIRNAAEEQNIGGKQVLEALTQINLLTTTVKDQSADLLRSSTEILSEITRLAQMSKENAAPLSTASAEDESDSAELVYELVSPELEDSASFFDPVPLPEGEL